VRLVFEGDENAMSDFSTPVRFTGSTGAGLYGAPAPTHKTACANSNNPFGHSDVCPCRRKSQTVPYEAEVIEFPGTGFDPGDAA